MTNEAKQCCVVAATLLYMIAMLIDAIKVRDTHLKFKYRFDGKLFNQRKLKTKTKLDEILYADDKDKVNGQEYQLIGINAWCNGFTWTIL